MVRAVVEGIIFHQKWLFESIEASFPVSGEIAFVGGGALSPVIAQMLSDILERPVRRLTDPRHAGSAGAAITMGVGLGAIESLEHAADYLETEDTFKPDASLKDAYRKNFRVFKSLYASNKKNFKMLNGS